MNEHCPEELRDPVEPVEVELDDELATVEEMREALHRKVRIGHMTEKALADALDYLDQYVIDPDSVPDIILLALDGIAKGTTQTIPVERQSGVNIPQYLKFHTLN